jgi:hypothetical protein
MLRPRTLSGKLVSILVLLLGFCSVQPVFSLDEPLLLVADLKYSGITEFEMKLLVDLFSYTIFETGGYLVMNRYERNKLLKGFGYNRTNLEERSVYLEAGELLRARYIVTGSCLQDRTGLVLELSLWDVTTGLLVKKAAATAPAVSGLIEKARAVTEELTGKRALVVQTAAGTGGLFASLYINPIHERILIVLPDGILDERTAAARLLVSEAANRLSPQSRCQLFLSSAPYDPKKTDPKKYAKTLSNRNCHTLSLIDFSQKLKVLFSINLDREEQAGLLAQRLEAGLPLLSTVLIARELAQEISIKEQLDELLFNEKLISQHFYLNVHQSVIKPVVVNKYHPLLNLLSIEADAYWYYADLFGIGAGYAFSLGYPATIDSQLASHPLVAQHEFRLIPLSFRTIGRISVVLNLIAAFNMHNAYRIVYNGPLDKYEYLDEKTLFFFKFGLNMGILFSIDDNVSVFLDVVTLSGIIPLNIGTVTYDGTNISGALGGLGVIFRF